MSIYQHGKMALYQVEVQPRKYVNNNIRDVE